MVVPVFMMMFMLVVVIVVFMFMMMIMLMVVRVLMLMVMFMLLTLAHAVNLYIGVHADDTAFRGYLKIEGDPGYAQCVELRLAGFPLADKVSESCREHVARSAHVAFEIKSLHVFILRCD